MAKKERPRVQKFFPNPSKTKQSFKDECDINKIVKRFKQVGVNLEAYTGSFGGHFGDFSEVVDYRTALDQINRAEEAFMALPAIVRKRFDNDPAAFLDFCGDPKNESELRELGLMKGDSVVASPKGSVEESEDPVSAKPKNGGKGQPGTVST